MPSDERSHDEHKVDRRTFIKKGVIAGGAVVGVGAAAKVIADAASGSSHTHASRPRAEQVSKRLPPRASRPNILVIVVDQLRYPVWFSAASLGLGYAPNLQRLSSESVNFARHYTASNDCTPARAALVTGLYTHQTGCMITGGSTLSPLFPTYGSMLREHGYRTRWLGKWHLTHLDNHWTRSVGEAELNSYGFGGGVYPSPDGGPGQGWRRDPDIARVFREWLREEGGEEPWCTTVSFVNPHDIAWWYLWTDRVPQEAEAPPLIGALPPNFETPELLQARRKPRLQLSFQETTGASFGSVPFTGPEVLESWLPFLDLYIKLQSEVDRHVGSVLDALYSRPEIAANTVILFTSDHGEYGASHGLRGKGASAYEEAIRVPLMVKDPRGLLTAQESRLRTQMTSSVDVAPLLLTIATGSQEWRREAVYSHIAGRLDLSKLLLDPSAPGREVVLHATDEIVTEYAIEPYAANAPLHIVAVRTSAGKLATYSNWPETGIEPLPTGREEELYDYSSQSGRMELHNSVGASAVEAELRRRHTEAFFHELREPLPHRLGRAHAEGFADYFSTARQAANGAIARRRKRSEEALAQVEALAREPGSSEAQRRLGPRRRPRQPARASSDTRAS